MGTIARGRGAGLEKYSLCGGACHSRPRPRAAGWAVLPQLQGLGRGAPEPAPGPLGRLYLHSHLPGVTLERTAVSSSQPMSNPESAQHRLNQGPKKTALGFAHLSAHLVVLGPQCPTDPCGFQRPESPAQTPATAPTQQLQEDTLWSAACKVLHILGVASNPSVPHPQTTSSKARYL